MQLRDYEEFVKIDNRYYGGDQTWLSEANQISKFWSDRSCGVIAASNTLCYMSKSKLATLNKQDFVKDTLLLYKYITPKIYGIPTVGIMKSGLSKYFKTKHHEITYHALVKSSDLLEVVEYIKSGLQENAPIMMVTWNTRIRNLPYHWVTITGYYIGADGNHYMVISNYGEKEIVNINQWVKEKSIYKGLLYLSKKGYN